MIEVYRFHQCLYRGLLLISDCSRAGSLIGDQISLLVDQYACYIISPRDIDTLSTMRVVGVATLINSYGKKLVSLTLKQKYDLVINY